MIIFTLKLVLRIIFFLNGMLWLCITYFTHFECEYMSGLDLFLRALFSPGFWRRFLTSLVSFVLAAII